jgi:hypothetical protein
VVCEHRIRPEFKSLEPEMALLSFLGRERRSLEDPMGVKAACGSYGPGAQTRRLAEVAPEGDLRSAH